MPAHTHRQHRASLQRIAHRAMLERGLLPTFSAAASAELQTMQAPGVASQDAGRDASGIRDLTDVVWASIDNDDSRDLDQLTVADTLRVRLISVNVERGFIDFSRVDLAGHASRNAR